MSRDKRYQQLLNAKEWQHVKRIVWQRANGLCERCKSEGHITPGVDCHHIVPVESAKSQQEMEQLAYNPDNCRLLCIACHVKTHKEMNSHTAETVKERRITRQNRWEQYMRQRFTGNGSGHRESDDTGG